ncbi:MAG: DUF3696 domain-containing protein [Methanosarcinaceae archaeon]|nr:DUF3696 domain-containing protein [Methanosarcinaceae archaeon]
MIKSIHLKNFKGFEDTKKIDFKPLTILCGTNSSGKSTIIQSILMLKQTFESQSIYKTILLNGQFVHLGSFEDLVHNKVPGNDVQINFELNPFKIPRQTRLGRNIPSLNFSLREFYFGDPPDDKNFENILEMNFRLSLPEKSIDKEPIVESLKLKAKTITQSNQYSNGTELEFTKIEKQDYLVKWKKTRAYSFERHRIKIPNDVKSYFCPKCKKNHRITSNTGKEHYYYFYVNENQSLMKASFINLIPEIGIEEKLEKGEHITQPHFHINRPLFSLRPILQNVFGNIIYIGPLRKEPSRRYIYEEEINNIGNRGENAPYILLIERAKKISPYHFFNKSEGRWEIIQNDTLEDGVNRWFNYMDISKGCNVESSKDIIRLFLQTNLEQNIKVTLADVGFGVSQILPILVEGLRIKPYQTLILEQPEIHLHPKLQMQLADFFISLILSGKRVLLETHSDHIINRIIRRIIEDEKDKIISKTNILFFEKENMTDSPQIRSIEIDSDRGLTKWPRGFFDQTAEETENILLAGINKRKKGVNN